MSVRKVEAIPEVVAAPAVPAKIVIELTMQQAQNLSNLVGHFISSGVSNDCGIADITSLIRWESPSGFKMVGGGSYTIVRAGK